MLGREMGTTLGGDEGWGGGAAREEGRHCRVAGGAGFGEEIWRVRVGRMRGRARSCTPCDDVRVDVVVGGARGCGRARFLRSQPLRLGVSRFEWGREDST